MTKLKTKQNSKKQTKKLKFESICLGYADAYHTHHNILIIKNKLHLSTSVQWRLILFKPWGLVL